MNVNQYVFKNLKCNNQLYIYSFYFEEILELNKKVKSSMSRENKGLKKGHL